MTDEITAKDPEPAAPKPTLKAHEVRILELERIVSTLVEGFHQLELNASRPSGPTGTPEYITDLLVAVISALRAVRQQGAWNKADELEAKYFGDEDEKPETVGDVVTTTTSLHSAGA